MGQTILTPFQIETLQLFKRTSLSQVFYLSGGTALSEFYLHHRKSEDLDFFTQKELDLEELKKFINLVSKKIPLKKIEFQHGFGLYTFFLTEKENKFVNKIDFGQYPFGPIEPLKNFDKLLVESLYDIGVNKTHTIAFHPRLRDFIDLYFILEEKPQWAFTDLLLKSFEKFEMRADPLQIGQNLVEVNNLADMPQMIKKINLPEIKKFFLNEAKKQGEQIIK